MGFNFSMMMKIILNNKTKILLTLFSITFTALIIFDQSQPGTIQNIKDKQIQFSEELGWINWSHAIPERNIKEFERFIMLQETQTDSFDFSFSMDMKIKVNNHFIIAACSQKYRVPVVTNKFKRQIYYAEIFSNVSVLLEDMQGELPYSLLSGSNASAHREGDLTGNLISLYACFNNQKTLKLKEYLTLMNVKDCIIKNSISNIDKNKIHSFNEVTFLKKTNKTVRSIHLLLALLQTKKNTCRLIKTKKNLAII